MVGAALGWRDHDLVALRGGVRTVATRHTSGLPLLHPWANRLARRRYVAAGVGYALLPREIECVHNDGLKLLRCAASRRQRFECVH